MGSHCRMIQKKSFTDYYTIYGQKTIPSTPVSALFTLKYFPVGEIQSHALPESNSYRESCVEKRALDRIQEDIFTKVRYAAEVHRQVRSYAQSFIKPGILLLDMCEKMENKNRELIEGDGLYRGIGFPTGCSVN